MDFSLIFEKLGDNQRKASLLDRAAAIKEKYYGRDHIQTAIAFTNAAHADGNVPLLGKCP